MSGWLGSQDERLFDRIPLSGFAGVAKPGQRQRCIGAETQDLAGIAE
jgi:hypothetical protein